MKKNKYLGLSVFFAMMMIMMCGLVVGTCEDVETSNSSTFTDVDTESDKEIAFNVSQRFGTFTLFTPNADFSHQVTENIAGSTINSTSLIHWNMVCDTFDSVNDSLSIKNVSVVIDRSNYTLISDDNETFLVKWNDARYTGASVTVYFNRTFCAGVDDIFLNPELVQTDYTLFDYFMESNYDDGLDYGSSVLFRVESESMGGLGINLSDWNVSWTYYDVVCGEECEGINSTLLDVILTFFILGMLVFIGYNIFNSRADTRTILYLVVGFLVMLVAMLIIKSILEGVCTV